MRRIKIPRAGAAEHASTKFIVADAMTARVPQWRGRRARSYLLSCLVQKVRNASAFASLRFTEVRGSHVNPQDEMFLDQSIVGHGMASLSLAILVS